MSNNALKINFGVTVGQAARQKALDHIQNSGKALPASVVKMKGSIATVKFETNGDFTLPNVTVPMYMPEYVRLPMQKGDKGLVLAGDVTLSNMTGLGPNSPSSFVRPGNLSPLLFVPVGNKDFTPVDPNKHTTYGPDGTLARPKDMSSGVGTDKNSGVTMAQGAPSGVDPSNVDLTAYDHHVTAGSSGIKAKSKTKVDVEAPQHNVTASTSVNITSPNTNVNGDLGVSSLLTAATAFFGAVSGASGGGGGGVMPLVDGARLGGGSTSNPAIAIAYQYVQPSSGGVVVVDVNRPVTVIDPASGLSSLTIDFPPAPDDATIIWLTFTQYVTTLTLSGATFVAHSGVTTVGASGAHYTFMYMSPYNAWVQI